MNKLVLIGNGFDLAHGLPTSYRNFLDSFWCNLKECYKDDLIKEIVLVNENYDGFFDFSTETNNFEDFWNNVKSYNRDRGLYINDNDYELRAAGRGTVIFSFRNDFFKAINTKNNIEGWVDVENEYYKQLKRIVNQPKRRIGGRIETDEQLSLSKKKEVTKLNKEFELVKKLLKEYLIEQINNKYNFLKVSTREEFDFLFEMLQSNNFFQNTFGYKSELNSYSKEFSFKEDRDEILKNVETLESFPQSHITFKTLFLDFNYTSTSKFYTRLLSQFISKYSLIKIHGDVNELIFGFGDENDEEYKNIENLDDNEYLKNFKSFYYSNDNLYDKLLQYIDSDKFQVWMMGHSCGLSDRVMLNTIFEHENCRSIKLFYHEREGKDNYQDLVMNISRHFDDKALMRKKVVDKSLCKPLPQGVRFKKREN